MAEFGKFFGMIENDARCASLALPQHTNGDDDFQGMPPLRRRSRQTVTPPSTMFTGAFAPGSEYVASREMEASAAEAGDRGGSAQEIVALCSSWLVAPTRMQTAKVI